MVTGCARKCRRFPRDGGKRRRPCKSMGSAAYPIGSTISRSAWVRNDPKARSTSSGVSWIRMRAGVELGQGQVEGDGPCPVRRVFNVVVEAEGRRCVDLVRTEVLGTVGVVHRLDEYFVQSVPKRPPCVGSRPGLGVHHPEAVAPIPVPRVMLPRCIVEAREVGEQEPVSVLSRNRNVSLPSTSLTNRWSSSACSPNRVPTSRANVLSALSKVTVPSPESSITASRCSPHS